MSTITTLEGTPVSRIITYEVTPHASGGFEAKGLVGGMEIQVHEDTEEKAILNFKDAVTLALPKANALIFITKDQKEAMEGYTEMEKHGG